MKYRVIKAFIDRLTQTPYNAGTEYETDDENRAKELAEAGAILMPIVKHEEAKQPETASESDTGEPEGEKEAAKATTRRRKTAAK